MKKVLYKDEDLVPWSVSLLNLGLVVILLCLCLSDFSTQTKSVAG